MLKMNRAMHYPVAIGIVLMGTIMARPASAVNQIIYADPVNQNASIKKNEKETLSSILKPTTISDEGFFNDNESYHVKLLGGKIINGLPNPIENKLQFEFWLTLDGKEIQNTRKSFQRFILVIPGGGPNNKEFDFEAELTENSLLFNDIHLTLTNNSQDSQQFEWSGYQLGVDAQKIHQVPGPLPVLGVAAAFGYSRKLRKRIKDSKTPEIMSAIT
jgi:hypothetical protein